MKTPPFIRDGRSTPFELVICDPEGVSHVVKLNDDALLALHFNAAEMARKAYQRKLQALNYARK